MSGRLPPRVDVAIIGGGFAGCATAWALRERGVRATILEREAELGRHASGRGAGLGRQLADDDETTALTVRGAAVLRERLGAHWTPTGGILAFDDLEQAGVYVERARRFHVPHELLVADAVRARWPMVDGLDLAAALFIPTDGVIDTRGLLHAYARETGLYVDAHVERITDGLVETARGHVDARVVVDATGAWSGPLIGFPPLDVRKRHLFVLEASPVSRTVPFLWHLGAHELYVRAAADGVLVSPCDRGATTASDQQPDTDAEVRLREHLTPASTTLASAGIVRRWACQRAFAADRRMRLGRDSTRPWLVHATALGGHGATASAAIGETVATEVLAALRDL